MDWIFGDIAFYFIQNVIAVLWKIKVVEVACVESAGEMKKCYKLKKHVCFQCSLKFSGHIDIF